MAARPRDQAPSEHEKAAAQALAQQVAALLEPILAEMDRKLDRISQQMDDLLALLAQWDAGGIHDLPARAGDRRQADSVITVDGKGTRQPCQEP